MGLPLIELLIELLSVKQCGHQANNRFGRREDRDLRREDGENDERRENLERRGS